MREDIERDDDIIDLGAATTLTQGDYLPKAKEQGYIVDFWDAP